MRLKRTTLLLFILMVSIALAACGGGQNDASPADSATPPNTNTPAPDAAGSKILRVGVSSDIETVDPHVGNMPRSTEAIANLYDQLFTYEIVTTADGLQVGDSEKVTGNLAKEWTVDASGKVYTITIHDNVYFSSGNKMTTEDVYYSFDRALNGGFGTGMFDMSVITIADIIEVVDEYTFIMRTNESNPFALNVLQMGGCSIVDSKVYKEHATASDPWAGEWAAKNAAGSGPFSLDTWNAGVDINFKANKDYWRYDVYYDGMVWKIVPEVSNQIMMIANNELDVIEAVPPSYLPEIENNPDLTIYSFPSQNILSFLLCQDPGEGPLGDVNVRRAIASAIPYEDIVEFVYFGTARIPRSVIPISTPTHDESGWVYNTDLAKAKAYLAESAYPDGFSFSMNISNSHSTHETIAILIQDALAKLNITVNIQKHDATAFTDLRDTAESFLNESLAWVDDPSYILNLALLDVVGSPNPRAVNYTYNKTFLDLCAESKYLVDPAQREANYIRIQQLICEDMPVIPLMQPNYNMVVRTGITGYVQYFDELVRFGPMTVK